MRNKMRSVAVILVLSGTLVTGQRPSFAGSRPIGYPELANRTTTEAGLGDKFGEDTTTQRLPIEANGDRDLVDRLSKLPIDQQPFWLLNWQALEAHRQKPQTYPQRPSTFVDPSLNPIWNPNPPNLNGNNNIRTETQPIITENPIQVTTASQTEDRFGSLPDLPISSSKEKPAFTNLEALKPDTNLTDSKPIIVKKEENVVPGKDIPEVITNKPAFTTQETNSKPSVTNIKHEDKITPINRPFIPAETQKPAVTFQQNYHYPGITNFQGSTHENKDKPYISTDFINRKPDLTYFGPTPNLPGSKYPGNRGEYPIPAGTSNKKPELSYLETYFKPKDMPQTFEKLKPIDSINLEELPRGAKLMCYVY